MNRRTLFETRRQLFEKAGFVVKSCFLYTKLDCRNEKVFDTMKQDHMI